MGCADEQADLKASGLWMVRPDGPGTEIRLANRSKELSCGWQCEVRIGQDGGDRENRSCSEASLSSPERLRFRLVHVR